MIYDILVVEDIVVVWIMIMILYGKVVRDLVVLLFYVVYMYMGFFVSDRYCYDWNEVCLFLIILYLSFLYFI